MPPAAINYKSLSLVGIGVPVTLTLVNQWVLAKSVPIISVFGTGLLFAFYALQIGFVSWAVGRYITPWPLRWFIWIWIMALVDLQLAVMTASVFSHAIRCLATSVLAGQLGALLVWGILGSGPMIWRIPSLLLLVLVAWNCYELLVRIRQNASWMQLGWNDLLNVEAVTLAALCGMLRLRCFSLQVIDLDGDGDGGEGSSSSTSLQFGIRDVLIWTTCLALLLGIAKAGDLLKLEFVQQTYAVGFLLVATVAISTAAVLLVAIWASLGRGRFTLRLLVLVLTALVVGTPLALYSVHIGQPMMVSNRDYRLAHWYAIGYWWISWMFLTATLLAASLIIFRTLGYRLVGVPRRETRLP